MKLSYSPRARDDLDAIHDFIATRNPSGAVDVLAAIYKSVELILAQPLAAPAADRQNLRVKLVAGYPYKIFYRATDGMVEIVHVRHAARRSLA